MKHLILGLLELTFQREFPAASCPKLSRPIVKVVATDNASSSRRLKTFWYISRRAKLSVADSNDVEPSAAGRRINDVRVPI